MLAEGEWELDGCEQTVSREFIKERDEKDDIYSKKYNHKEVFKITSMREMCITCNYVLQVEEREAAKRERSMVQVRAGTIAGAVPAEAEFRWKH